MLHSDPIEREKKNFVTFYNRVLQYIVLLVKWDEAKPAGIQIVTESEEEVSEKTI